MLGRRAGRTSCGPMWSSPQPATGVARMELRIGPDVGFVSSPTPAG